MVIVVYTHISHTFFGDLGIQSLNGVVVLEKLEHVAVGLPEELDPGSQEHPVRPLLHPLPAHCTQQQAAGRTRTHTWEQRDQEES